MADEENNEGNELISVVQAGKLISKSSNGNPKGLREFCEGVEAARQVVNPTKTPFAFQVHRI
jgi:hypothetical protein